jgi:hypothetical protein
MTQQREVPILPRARRPTALELMGQSMNALRVKLFK